MLYRRRIEHYLNGELSEAEKASFEIDLQHNKELSDAFEAYLKEQNLLTDEENPSEEAIQESSPRDNPVPDSESFSPSAEDSHLDETARADYTPIDETTYEEGNNRMAFLGPIFIFLIGLTLYFLIKSACSPPPPSILDMEGEVSETVEDALEEEPDAPFDDLSQNDGFNADTEANEANAALDADTTISNSVAPPPPSRKEKKDCQELVSEASELYEKGKYTQAQIPLAILIKDDNTACQADAYFHLGRIRLKLGDPYLALDCLAKVNNIEKYGDDIPWYMALCFYEMAQDDPDMRSKAKRAFERVLTTPQSEERYQKAREIIEELQSSI